MDAQTTEAGERPLSHTPNDIVAANISSCGHADMGREAAAVGAEAPLKPGNTGVALTCCTSKPPDADDWPEGTAADM